MKTKDTSEDFYGYLNGKFQVMDRNDWEKSFSIEDAKKYLNVELKQSLINDFLPCFEVFKEKRVGNFAILRIIFPYITFLGTLYRGKEGSTNCIRFMIDYLGKVHGEYRDKSAIYYVVYRHGLEHTNMPKIITNNKKKLGWLISFQNATHRNQDDYLYRNLLIYPKLLFDDLIKAIDIYLNDLSHNEDLFENFKKGLVTMCRIHNISDIASKIKNKQDAVFIESLLNKGIEKYGI